ncbi:hypothetical protein Tco_0196799 [Tanacetum coccineum]
MQNIPYASAIGSIMYAVRCTRPDVAFAQNMTSRFQHNPGEEHWTATDAVEPKDADWNIFLYIIAALDASKEAVDSMMESLKFKTFSTPNFHLFTLRETIKMGDVKIEKIDTDDNLADPFTKAVWPFPQHYRIN